MLSQKIYTLEREIKAEVALEGRRRRCFETTTPASSNPSLSGQ